MSTAGQVLPGGLVVKHLDPSSTLKAGKLHLGKLHLGKLRIGRVQESGSLHLDTLSLGRVDASAGLQSGMLATGALTTRALETSGGLTTGRLSALAEKAAKGASKGYSSRDEKQRDQHVSEKHKGGGAVNQRFAGDGSKGQRAVNQHYADKSLGTKSGGKSRRAKISVKPKKVTHHAPSPKPHSVLRNRRPKRRSGRNQTH